MRDYEQETNCPHGFDEGVGCMICDTDRAAEAIGYDPKNYPEENPTVIIIDSNDLPATASINWRTDLESIPLETEVLVTWNHTKSRHTKSVAMRDKEKPDRLWVDGIYFISITACRHWMEVPEVSTL